MATNIVVSIHDIHNGLVAADLYGADGLAASDDGYWIYVGDLEGISVHFSGISGDTCKLYGANVVTEPADATDHIQISGDITTDSIVNVTTPILWLKADLTRSAGTAVHAYMIGHRRGF